VSFLSNSNLKTFDNFYADLAQSAYTGRPIKFPYNSLTRDRQKKLDSGYSIPFDFSQDVVYGKEITPGGKKLDNDGKVYLQPDPDLHVEKGLDLPFMDDNDKKIADYKEKAGLGPYQKGRLTNERVGFNAYFLTDTPTLGKDTKHTYMAIRGSDGFNIERFKKEGIKPLNLNDWLVNDANFALFDSHIPQARLATEGMKATIAEMSEKAPNATMDLTAHSLGTMVTVQGIANLSQQEFDKIGKVVLFDGPDTTDSLKKMGVDDDRIQAISEKLEYYVNPFDIVSMLNRENTIYNLEKPGEKPTRKELGTAHIVVPLHYTRFDFMSDSAHDFGVFQADGKGGFLVASEDFHPELLRAGEKLARLEAKFLDLLRMQGLTDDEAIKFMNAVVDVSSFGTANFARAGISTSAFYEFKRDYQAIIDEARRESIKWDKKMIPSYQKQLGNGNLTGEDRILVRARLLQTAAQLAIFEMEDKVKHVQTLLSDAKEFVQNTVKDTSTEAMGMVTYLSGTEVASLLADFNVSRFWDDTIESNTETSAKGFMTEIEQLGMTLVRASGDFAAVDTQQAEDFNNLLADVKGTWRGKNGSDSK